MTKQIKRSSALMCALVLLLSLLPIPASAASGKQIDDGWYMIVSGNSDNRVLDIHNNSQENGGNGNLEIYQKNNTTNQRFYLKYLNNGYYSIQAQHSKKYLHKANGGHTDDVHQWSGYGATNTQWALEPAGNGYYYIRSRSGNYMDNSGGKTKNGNNVGTARYNGSANQKWKFLSTSTTSNEKQSIADGWYMIESGNSSNRVLDIHDNSQANGGNLETYQKQGSKNQLFYLQYRNNGYYSIMVQHSGKYLHKANSGYTDDVHQWTGYGAMNTQWALEPAGNGYYYIRSKSGNYMDNSGGRTTNGNNVGTYVFNGTAAQKWKFIKSTAVPAEPASTLKISGQKNPGTIQQGSGFSIKGTITSNYIITNVTVGIYDANGNPVSTKSASPNSYSYNVNNLDNYIRFGQAKAGTNYYRVWATDQKAGQKLLQETKFTVTGAASTLKISGQSNPPGTIQQGSGFSIKGTITSNYIITNVTVGIYDANGNPVSTKSASPNSYSYNVHNLDNYIRFGQAKAGINYYRVWATDKMAGQKLLQETKFTVTGVSSTLKISGETVPGNINQGSAFIIKGTITSNCVITNVTVGIYDASGKAVSTKSVNPNAYSYNINKLDNYIRFGTLGVGSYTFRITAKDSSGNSINKSNPFTVVKPAFSYRTMAESVHEVQGSRMCVLTSISMLIRSKLYLDNRPYSTITQNVVRQRYNNGVLNASWDTICSNANNDSSRPSGTLKNKYLGGSAASNMNTVRNLVSSRKEGVVVYFWKNGSNQHAVRICNYENGTFMVSDPANTTVKYVSINNSLIGNGHYTWGENFWAYANIVIYYE